MANVQFVENFHQFRLSVCDVVHQIVTSKRVNAVELSSFQLSGCFLFRFSGEEAEKRKRIDKNNAVRREDRARGCVMAKNNRNRLSEGRKRMQFGTGMVRSGKDNA